MNSPFEYQESLNSLHFTEEEKAAIARRAAEALRPHFPGTFFCAPTGSSL